jgi:hypothetical protein
MDAKKEGQPRMDTKQENKNRRRIQDKGGEQIYVDAIADGSGECIDKIINDPRLF